MWLILIEFCWLKIEKKKCEFIRCEWVDNDQIGVNDGGLNGCEMFSETSEMGSDHSWRPLWSML